MSAPGAMSSALPPVVIARPRFYIGLALVMTAIVLAGFWPYYAALLTGTSQASWALHLHGAVFTGWLALLLAQVMLVYRGRTDLHRGFGRFAVGYAFLLLVVGVLVTVTEPARHVAEGRWTLDQGAAFLLLPTVDILIFAGLFGAAVAYRFRKDLHKRLMVLAAIMLIFPAAARAGYETAGVGGALVLWLVPLALAMAYDRVTDGRVHKVYWLGLAIFIVAFARIPFMDSEAWLRFGRPLMVALSH